MVYDPLREALTEFRKEDLTPKIIYDTIIKIREERIPDPKVQGNAGSFFKNPIIDQAYLDKLLEEYPDMPNHKMLDGNYKIPAAWLIQESGWKGRSHEHAGVSSKHALVLVNLGGATGKNIAELYQMVQDDVNHKFGIYLEPEVIVL